MEFSIVKVLEDGLKKLKGLALSTYPIFKSKDNTSLLNNSNNTSHLMIFFV
jgi:hypothetical protein